MIALTATTALFAIVALYVHHKIEQFQSEMEDET